MRVGIVGVGIAGTSHLFDVVSGEQFTAAAVCASRRERAVRIAHTFGVPAAYGDVDAMLAEIPLDSLVIAVPPAASPSILQTALRLPVPIVIDKPAAPDAAALRRVLSTVDFAASSRVVVAYNRRYSPALYEARRTMDSGAMGAPVGVVCRWTGPFRQRYRVGATYRQHVGWGEGVLVDTASHIVDALCFLGFNGLAVRRARLGPDTTAADTQVRLALRSPDNVPIVVSIDDDVNETSAITVRCERGSFTLTGSGVEFRPAVDLVSHPALDLGRPVDDLLRIARGEPAVGATLADAVNVLDVIDQARAAAGRPAAPWRRPRAKALGRINGAC